MSNQYKYRVTVEEFSNEGWRTVQRTCDPDAFKHWINMSGFARLVSKTRTQLRYLFQI